MGALDKDLKDLDCDYYFPDEYADFVVDTAMSGGEQLRYA